MAKPVIESGDITLTEGSGTTAALDTPAYEDGDLLIAMYGQDDDITANNPTAPTTGPFGETLILNNLGSGGSASAGPTQGMVAWIGTQTRGTSTIDWTWSGAEGWGGYVIKVLAGEFDATTPLGAASGFGGLSSNGSNPPTPVWTLDSDDGGGAILVHIVVDSDPITGTASGWTITENEDHGDVSGMITQRDAESVNSETTVEVTYTIVDDTASSLGIVIRAPSGANITNVDSDYGAASDEFDVDENSLDVNGTLFESSQGSGKVWLADETTLAASSAEIDLDAAINTWADTEVNLDLNDLSAGDKTSVEALIVSDGPELFIILVNNSSEETSLPVTVHRAKAFAMSLSANIAASGENTTGQLTAPTSGSFGGGRIQDDENPADTVDIGDDEFFEDEWCIEALTNSVYDETYLFRVLVGANPAATITVIPGLTVEAATGETASGSPSITKPTSTGIAEIQKQASGSPSITAVTATGVSEIKKIATGAPSIAAITSTGSIQQKNSASGTPSITKPTSTGIAEIQKQASGAPSITKPTSTGVSEIIKPASGAPSITKPTSAGSIQQKNSASGTPSITAVTSTGVAEIQKQASGSPSITPVTSAGVAEIQKQASGTPSITKPTSTGVAEVKKIASGTPSITKPTSTGIAEIKKTASGSPSITKPTSSGTLVVTNKASGTPSITKPTSTGVAEIQKIASGSPTLQSIASAGVAKFVWDASGAPSITAITSTGVAEVKKLASGSPSIQAVTASGAATIKKQASGAPSTSPVTSSGTASLKRLASGSPSITPIVSAGTAEIKKIGSGAPSITAITSTGVSEVKKIASGSPSITPITSAGVTSVNPPTITDVNTTESWFDGDTGLIITGTGFV